MIKVHSLKDNVSKINQAKPQILKFECLKPTGGIKDVINFFLQADDVPYVLVRPDRALLFPSVETIRTKLTSSVAESSIE